MFGKNFIIVLFITVTAIFIIAIGYYFLIIIPKEMEHKFGTGDYYVDPPQVKELPQETPKKSNCSKNCQARILDGMQVDSAEANLFPITVVIENHPAARPQSGLNKASIVYEAEAEGGITRFLAVYADKQKIDRIGPIRSARPYFVDIASEYRPLFVHCGGSPDGLAEIKTGKVKDFNQFFNGKYFWRDENRPAPHNVYTSMENMRKFLANKGLTKGNFSGWDYAEKIDFDKFPYKTADVIKFKFPHSNLPISWKYDKINNEYSRAESGIAIKDDMNERLTANNVIIQIASQKIMDEKLRLKIGLVGKGEAVLCREGRCIKGSWQKASKNSRTNFYIDSGQYRFYPGKTWIEIINSNNDYSIK